jgi:AcrR family transcriptional regulator
MRTLDPSAHAHVRGHILAAARRLFATRGYHATSMNEVARSAGMAKAALYHYFKGKHAMLHALHQGAFDGAAETLGRAPRMKNLREAMAFLGRGYLEHFRQPGPAEVMRIALNVNGEDPELLRLSSTVVMPRMQALLENFLKPYFPKGTPAGEARRHILPFFGALFYYRFVLQSTCGPGQLPDEDEYLDHLVGLFAKLPPGRKRPARNRKLRGDP